MTLVSFNNFEDFDDVEIIKVDIVGKVDNVYNIDDVDNFDLLTGNPRSEVSFQSCFSSPFCRRECSFKSRSQKRVIKLHSEGLLLLVAHRVSFQSCFSSPFTKEG